LLKKKQNSYDSGLNASSRDFSWLDRATSVYNAILCVDVCLLLVSEDWEWLKLKEKSVLVCVANVNLFDGNIKENVTERKNAYAGFSLHKDTTPPQPNHTVTTTHIEPEK